MSDKLKIERVSPYGDGVQWPIEAKDVDEAWQIMQQRGYATRRMMTQAELEERFPSKA